MTRRDPMFWVIEYRNMRLVANEGRGVEEVIDKVVIEDVAYVYVEGAGGQASVA